MIKIITDIFTQNPKIKIYAFLVSFILWAFVLGQRNFMVNKEIGLEYLVDSNMALEGEPVTIEVTLQGKRAAIRSLKSEDLSVSVDLRGQLTGEKRIFIDKSNISLPVGVKLVKAKPASVEMYLQLKPLLDKE